MQTSNKFFRKYSLVLLRIVLFFQVAFLPVGRGASSLAAQENSSVSYYRSNAVGMALEPLGEKQPEQKNLRRSREIPWLLKEIRKPGRTEKILYRKGLEKERRVREESRRGVPRFEEIYRNGRKVLRERKKFNDAGLIQEHFFYDPKGALREKILFFYDEKGTLRSWKTYNEKNRLREERRYSIGENGLLAEVSRKDSGGTRISSLNYGRDGEPYAAREGEGSVFSLILFDEKGEKLRQDFLKNGRLLRRIRYLYGKSAGGAEEGERKTLEEDRETGEKKEEVFDGRGRLIRRRVQARDQRLLSFLSRHYEGDRLLSESQIDEDGESRSKVYFYADSGALKSMNISRNGELERVIRYSSGGRREETLYSEGRAFLKQFYRNDRPVREVPVRPEEAQK